MKETIQYLRKKLHVRQPKCPDCTLYPGRGECRNCSAHRALDVLESVPVEALRGGIRGCQAHIAGDYEVDRYRKISEELLAWLNAYQGKEETKSGN